MNSSPLEIERNVSKFYLIFPGESLCGVRSKVGGRRQRHVWWIEVHQVARLGAIQYGRIVLAPDSCLHEGRGTRLEILLIADLSILVVPVGNVEKILAIHSIQAVEAGLVQKNEPRCNFCIRGVIDVPFAHFQEKLSAPLL